MNRAFFQQIRLNTDIANACASRVSNFARNFSEIFANVFGEIDENMWSWLDAISSNFEFTGSPLVNQSVEQLFQDLELNPAEHTHDFQFWTYLVTMYGALGARLYSKNDNIFAFMKDFKITDTRVVILGEDPPKGFFKSSGYAFHLSNSESYACLIEYLKEHYDLLSTFNTRDLRIQQITTLAEPQNIIAADSLQGWVQQNVLLMNNLLTSKEPQWEILTQFILRYINDNVNHVAFILAGLPAKTACDNVLINRQNHLVLELLHPIYYRYPENERDMKSLRPIDWKKILPFINANLFLSHYSRGHIDWKSVTRFNAAANNLEEMNRLVTSLQNLATEEERRGQLLQWGILVNTDEPREGFVKMKWVELQAANGRYLQLELKHPHEL